MNYLNKLFLLSAVVFGLSIQPKVLASDRLERAKQLYQQNNYPEAIELLETAIAQYQQEGKRVKSITALRNLALVHQKLGQWQEAESTLAEA